ncbi:MAG: PCP reductase family protein [Armatimonadetes bacterium]|nr:PCP reductase family protein [Armatimonadota bacterium]
MELVRGTLVQQRDPEPAPADVRAAAPVWTAEASQRLERVPEFVRPMARQAIERYATEQGYREITVRVVDEARARYMP